MKNSKPKPGKKSWKNIYEIFSSVPAMFDFVQEGTNEQERQYFKKHNIKWLVKNTFISFAGIGIFSIMVVSCQKDDLLAPDSLLATRQEKAPSAKTGQSLMIDVDIPDLIIEGSQVWKFDRIAAAIADFEWNKCTAPQCRMQAEEDARSTRCEYWNMAGRPYWTLAGNTVSGNAQFSINTLLVSELFRLGGQFKTNGKYSFTMRTPKGTSRLVNLAYTVNGGPSLAIGHVISDGAESNNCFLDLNYSANNGPYGNPGIYTYLKTGETIGAIFASDDVPGNDAGCPNVSVAVADPVLLTLGPGMHTIVISGTLSGTEGTENISINQVKNFTISSASCAL